MEKGDTGSKILYPLVPGERYNLFAPEKIIGNSFTQFPDSQCDKRIGKVWGYKWELKG